MDSRCCLVALALVEWAVLVVDLVVGLAADDDDDFHFHDGDDQDNDDAQDGGGDRDDDDGFLYGVDIPDRDSSDSLEILENLGCQELLGILDTLGYLCVPCDLCPFYKLVL